INADVANTQLVLDTGNAVVNAGLLEATGGGILALQDGEITNSGKAASNKGLAINASTLLVDVGSLKFDGGGDVTLTADTITGQSATNELDNVANSIVGTGLISNLDLDNSGTINANDTSGGILRLATGTVIENLAGGLMEASAGGKLEIDDNLSNSALLEATGGSTIDFKGSSISWDGSATPAA